MRLPLSIIIVVTLFGCARQTQPGGGPKDQDPPELKNSIPVNGQRNFSGKTIELTFNEAIKLKDPREEILIIPSMGPNTKFVAKKNRLIITPQQKLDSNTTYSLAFRDGVQDLNESNPAEDLHLAFSTGPTIDSLNIVGYVTEIFKERPPQKITIALYQSDTFDIFKHRPVIFTKTNKLGRFNLPNLKAGTYYIYAFDDKNKNKKVDSQSERFGFITTPLTIPEQKDSIQIPIYRVDSRKIKLTSVRNSSTTSLIRFNKPLDSLKLFAEKPIIYTFGSDRSEILVYKEFEKSDSLKIWVRAQDSVWQTLDTAVYVKYTDNKPVEDKFTVNAWDVLFDPQTSEFEATTAYSKLLLSLNYDSIYVQIDTARIEPIAATDIRIDTLRKKISIRKKLAINLKEKIPTPYLLFGKGALISASNDSSKGQDLAIKILKPEETGTIALELTTVAPHFETQLTTAKNTVVKSTHDTKKFSFNFVEPADYRINIITDNNNNRRWDAGNYYQKKEPEKVTLYKSTENKYIFPIRANWEVGPLPIAF